MPYATLPKWDPSSLGFLSGHNLSLNPCWRRQCVRAAFVLRFQIRHQRLKVSKHGACVEVFAGSFFQQRAPVAGGTGAQDVAEEVADFGAAVVIGRMRILLEDFGGDVVVELKQDEEGEAVVVILRRIVDGVRFGASITVLIATLRGRPSCFGSKRSMMLRSFSTC